VKLYVICPGGDDRFAEAVRTAGAIPVFELDPREIDGHPVAAGATGAETIEAVRTAAASGASPLARGALDSNTVRACADAGAAGLIVDAAFWMVEQSPLSDEDRRAIAELSLPDFAAGSARLPSGLTVGRDALLAPFVARRDRTVARAVEAFLRSAGQPSTPHVERSDERPARGQADTSSSTAVYETEPLPEAVAIIGVGAILPKANSSKAFWQNVLDKVDAIIEVPPDRWDASLHHNPDPAVPDATYSKIGGFVTGFRFDPLRFRIPPSTARALDPVQQMALTAAAEALADAGYDEKPFDRSRCAVILGNSMGGERKGETDKRLHMREFAAALTATAESDAERARIERAEREILEALPAITEDSMPGELANVIAGRVANVLDLSGKNLTTDAACASSHAALDTAVKAILDGDADMALCGGADRTMDAGTYVKFSKIGALSATGSRPFDAGADGFVMGEGAAVLLLKRLSDAVRDGDRIYAVIRAIGSSSDGRGKGITAPNPQGQKLAVRRAFAGAGIEPRHVQLLEAHGTSTRVGDVVEVQSAAELFEGVPPATVAMGSVKSQIGHLKSAAGAAGLMKAALALHHQILPPSINLRTPNPNIDWDRVPFYVNTEARPWPDPPSGEPRRAAVSAFGFGGTNFHVILEEYVPGYHGRPEATRRDRPGDEQTATPSPAVVPASSASKVGGELVVIGAGDVASLADAARHAAETISGRRDLAEAARRVRTREAHAQEQRLAFGTTSTEELGSSLEVAAVLVAVDAKRAALGLRVKGAAYGRGPRPAGKVAFLFPGQGSQYANMCGRLAEWSDVVRDTFAEADAVLEPLIGSKLTDLVFVDPDDASAVARAEEALTQTEITQPAMLAADVALSRLLEERGIRPDMVAGHSLGEYAALVAAGVLSFADALAAVSARGREMANVRIEDHGLMASFSCGPDQAEEILANVDGYVVAANKNCPVQTVVAGETAAVRRSIELAGGAGVDAHVLPVSAAFHTRIVAPASEPLRRVFDRLDVRPPGVPVIGNVDARPYPSDPDAIRDLLARQVASPVEWAASLEALYDAGCRIFVEVGPKRALASFVDATLGGRGDVVSVITNHPKRGDVESFLDALARFAALGWDLGFSAALPEPAVRTVDTGRYDATRNGGGNGDGKRSGAPNGHGPNRAAGASSFEALSAAVMPSVEAALRQGASGLFDELARLRERLAAHERFGLVPADVVVSGAAMGLPGQSHRVFDDGNIDRLFAGENRIDRLDPSWAERFLDKDLVRLVKDGGDPRLEHVSRPEEVLKLAGRSGELDLERDYDIPPKLVRALDVTSKLAVAAGFEALWDAGIPMVQERVATSAGTTLPGPWLLPADMRSDTGVVFASAFPGYDSFVREISRHLSRRLAGRTLRELEAVYHRLLDAVPEERRPELSRFFAERAGELQRLAGDEDALDSFNRHFLFSVLAMGHAELAQLIGARGPNTQVNAACSSTTQAIAVAEDWIRAGRCRRVIVVGADDVTTDAMLEWIGSGFLVSGAATTAGSVEEGALPFDRRRHGLIIGMGAVGLVVERREDVEERGMVPVARVVATSVSNGAFHGSRLSTEHLSERTSEIVRTAAARLGTTPGELAGQTLFVSHETYTPPRGGSASAEAAGLRNAFGAASGSVLVTNTKGFTGHAMGAGIEDALAVKALQFGRVPPIANLRDVDPEFDGLNLSRGGGHERRFALRLSAGFGSQLALAFFEKMAEGDRRIVDAGRYQGFLDRAAGGEGRGRTERVGRVLRLVATEPEPSAVPVAAPAPEPVGYGETDPGAVLDRVIELVAERTGYPTDVLDPELDLEADLGIDTVKQAELFGELRGTFDIPRDEGIQLKDYPTLAAVAAYLASRIPDDGGGPGDDRSGGDPEIPDARGRDDVQRVQATVTSIVGRHTGYPDDVLDPDLDMEADLGIDTVKQAEIFGEVREAFAIPRIDGLQLKDYPTIGHVTRLIAEHASGENGSKPVPGPADDEVASGAPALENLAKREMTIGLTRRAPRVVPAPAVEDAERSAFVVGDGPFADELRRRLPDPDGAVAVFVGDARELFRWARGHAAELEAGSVGVLAVTHLGGAHAVAGHAAAEEGIGVAGLAKALAAEFPAAFVRALDLDPNEDVAIRAKHVERELEVRSSSAVEVGRTRRRRVTVATVELGPAEGHGVALPDGAVVVASGGGRGITAEALRGLAPMAPVLILLGRTEAPDEDEPDLDEAAIERLRTRAAEDLRAAGERATPVAVERRIASARARAEVARSIRDLRSSGATVEYHSVDVVDERAVRAVLDGVRARYGRIDGVVHAAGVEESRRLADKDDGAFDRSWAPKVEGLRNLVRATERDDLRFLVVFGSVAGRYGNGGQADYAAANDACAKLAAGLWARGVPASVFAWGPWGETGMATRGSALTVLEAAGVERLPTADAVGAERRWTLEPRAALLDHHRVGGVPYLAGALGLEATAELAGGAVQGFEDVRFDYPVKLLRDEPVDVTVTLRDDGTALLTSIPAGPTAAPRVHFRAGVRVGMRTRPGEPQPFDGAPWTFDRIYPPLFHGPAFRVLAAARGVAVDGIEAAGRRAGDALSPLAATIEGAFQTLGLWAMAVPGVAALPHSVSRIDLPGPLDPSRTVYRAFRARSDGGLVTADVECVLDGRVVARLTGLKLVATGPAALDPIPAVWRSDELLVGRHPIVRVAVGEARRLLRAPELLPRWLSPGEVARLTSYTVPKRREEWLAATLAAKSALRTARDVRPWNEIDVIRGEAGAPLAHGHRGITLSHAAGVAVARVFDLATERTGIDVEHIEPRPSAFEEEAFTDEERAGFPEDQDERALAVTMAWTAKEAALKALGLGLSADLHSVVTRRNGGGIAVELVGKARERQRQEGVARLDVATVVEDSSSMTVVTGTLAHRNGR
jgi:acyl transferase domain-containing protein/phosphopantetheinyl transferase/acyl carrier protein